MVAASIGGSKVQLHKWFGHNVLLDMLRNGSALEAARAAAVSTGEAEDGGAHHGGALRVHLQDGHEPAVPKVQMVKLCVHNALLSALREPKVSLDELLACAALQQ
jgi:hypothetical protein